MSDAASLLVPHSCQSDFAIVIRLHACFLLNVEIERVAEQMSGNK